MAHIYIDFERYREIIIEVGAVLVYNQQLISAFHSLVDLKFDDMKDYHVQAEHSHCIYAYDLQRYGLPPAQIKREFIEWIKQFDFSQITIHGHGDDVTKNSLLTWNPKLNQLTHLTYKQVILPPWIERETAPYHLAAFKMKEVSKRMKCSKDNHQVTFQTNTYNSSNHSKIARIIYKHHCALVDAFELAFFEQQLPLFCCDKDFEPVICKHAKQYMICTTTLY